MKDDKKDMPFIIITRPVVTAGSLINFCRDNGLDFMHLPVMNLVPVANLSNINLMIEGSSVLLFVSPTAIDISACYIDFDRISAKLLVLGKASANLLSKYTSKHIYYPDTIGDSESILRLSIWDCKCKYLSIIKGNKGRDLLKNRLKLEGWHVNEVIVYNQVIKSIDKELLDGIDLYNRKSIVIITSSEMVSLLFKNIPQEYFDYFKDSYYISIHNRISDKLKGYGVSNIITTRLDEKLILKIIKSIGEKYYG